MRSKLNDAINLRCVRGCPGQSALRTDCVDQHADHTAHPLLEQAPTDSLLYRHETLAPIVANLIGQRAIQLVG